jgi:hypothetical protein
MRGAAIRCGLVVIAAAAVMIACGRTQAQIIQQAVGGVAISTEGVLTVVKTDLLRQVANTRRKALAQLPGDLNQPTTLRSISLSRLQAAIADCQKTNRPLPDDIRYLAGLQRVEYVFLDPHHHDIVLAGPAEGWVVNEQGEVVGAKNGRAVLRLEDLLVALRSADQARNGGISCSIDPTPEGIKRRAICRCFRRANRSRRRVGG